MSGAKPAKVKRFKNYCEVDITCKGDWLLQGKKLIKAINMRIAYAQGSIEYFEGRITELKTEKNNTYAKKHLAKWEAEIVKHKENIKFYKAERENIYKRVDFILRNETDDYKALFKALFLDDLKPQEITELYGYSTKSQKIAMNKIKKDMFDRSYQEYANDNIQDNGRDKGENET